MRNVVLYAIIIAASILVPLNPVVVWLLTGVRSFAAYILVLDLLLLLIIAAGVLYLRTGRRPWLVTGSVLVVGLLPAMVAAEAAYVYLNAKYGGRVFGELPQIFQEDPDLVYAMRPEVSGRHVLHGNFDVVYETDERGRKAIPRTPHAPRTIHVFGDSFTFGFGVANADTWLNLVDAELGEEVDVLNYGVMGYALEQMVLSLERHRDEIAPGDLVIFAPISADLERSLVGRTYVCGGTIRAEANEIFPKLETGTWRMARLDEECSFVLDTLLGNSPFPASFGALYRQMRHRQTYDQMIANADRLFAMADEIASAQGAGFEVVFLVTPHECAAGALTIDLSPLRTPHRSFMPYCPGDHAGAMALAFPNDGHWSPAGHRWAAAAFLDLLGDLPQDDEAAQRSVRRW
jgi:hypothetical protein